MKCVKWVLENTLHVRLGGVLLFVALAAIITPIQAWSFGGGFAFAATSLAVGLLFVGVALLGRTKELLKPESTKESLDATNRAKRILWIWAGFGGAIIVLSLSAREQSSMDEAFGMVGFGWLLPGIAALLLESVSFSREDAISKNAADTAAKCPRCDSR